MPRRSPATTPTSSRMTMIGRLRGELLELEGGRALLDVGGVGYDVLVPEGVAAQLIPNSGEVILLTRQVFREDGVTLYGFLEPFQRRLFDLLMGVQGCGPKASLALIGQVGEEAVASAIVSQDARTLTRANGVGAKLAERIILELREKLQDEVLIRKSVAATPGRKVKASPADDLVEALLALGYRRSDAESAATSAREEANDVEGQLRAALRILQR